MSEPLPLAIPECRLEQAALGPQIRRYRQLATHVTQIERTVGEVRVEFDDRVPTGLLGHTLAVERDCCTFVGIDYKPQSRTLTFTVGNIAQDPRLDSLAALLTGPAAGSSLDYDASGRRLSSTVDDAETLDPPEALTSPSSGSASLRSK